ncbi:hypothetical protein F5883DRAFT_564576 [Diaporthe sp. PMI_573]|nr:hypothetical protein F5883DRAFT_564576 [Diaporthaceae sp. PMI_573]
MVLGVGYVLFLQRQYCWDTRTSEPPSYPPARFSYVLFLLTSLRDKNPPSTHSFSLQVMSAFLFSFSLFILIPHCLLRLLRGNDHDQHNHREGERKKGLDWSKSSVGLPSPGLITVMALMEGPSFFLCQTSLRGVGLLACFSRDIQGGYSQVCEREKMTERESQRKSMGDIVDGSSRIMLPG